jgi:hypothetical protein
MSGGGEGAPRAAPGDGGGAAARTSAGREEDGVPGPMTPRPLFVVGSGRSGSTIVAETLARAPRVFKAEGFEPKLFSDMNGFAGLFSALYTTHYSEEMLRERAAFMYHRREGGREVGLFRYIDEATFTALMDGFWLRARALAGDEAAVRREIRGVAETIFAALGQPGGIDWLIDDTPINALRLKEIFDVFPEARVVHVIRDGRQVALGHMRLGWCGSFHEGLHLWRSRVDAARLVARHMGGFGGRYREVEFGRLAADPEGAFGELFAWLGLAFDPAFLEAAGFSRGRVNRYPITDYEDALFRALAADLVAEFGWP